MAAYALFDASGVWQNTIMWDDAAMARLRMKRTGFLGSSLFALLAASPALAQGGYMPPLTDQIRPADLFPIIPGGFGGVPPKYANSQLISSYFDTLAHNASGAWTFTGPVTLPAGVGGNHVPNNAAAAALAPTATGQIWLVDGYSSPGDGGNKSVVSAVGACAAADGITQIQVSGYCLNIVKQQHYDVRIWGYKVDYVFGTTGSGTDNTAPLAAAIAFAENPSGAAQGVGPALWLPDGPAKSGPQTITGQIEIDCASNFASVLVLKSTSNAPMLTYLPTGYNFPGDGHPHGVTFTNKCRITSEDGSAANATYPNASAISIPRGAAWELWAYFDDDIIYNMPGNGIDGSSSSGLAYFKRPYIQNVGGYGLSTNSTNDWVLDGLNVGLSRGVANILNSGDSSIYYHNLNSYSAVGYGYEGFGRLTATFDGHTEINLNGNGGIFTTYLTSLAVINVSDLVMAQNSQNSTAYRSDIYSDHGAGAIKISRGNFGAPFSISSSNSSSYNVQYAAGSADTISCADCTFAANWNDSRITNNVTNFFATGAGADVPWLVAKLPSPPPAGLAVRYRVTDATACSTWHGALTGGGATPCGAVYLNGAWVQD